MRRLADGHGARRWHPTEALKIASPDNPVTWDIADDNQPIGDGLQPEKGPLLLYNYADYIGPAVVKSFEEKYGVDVKISTFNDTDEALTKIRTGAVPFDIYFPSYDQIARMVTAKLVRPLNHSYLGNLGNVWPTFAEPLVRRRGALLRALQRLHDRRRLAHRPGARRRRRARQPLRRAVGPGVRAARSASSTTGTPRWRWSPCAPASPTSTARSPTDLEVIQQALTELGAGDQAQGDGHRCTTTCPSGQLGISQMWSGDVVNAQYYLPKGQSVDVLRYWFPEDGMGLVDNDLMVVLSGGKNPVLAHLFLDHMLDEKNSLKNFGYIGYQPPQNALDTDRAGRRRLPAREPRDRRRTRGVVRRRATGCSS